MLTFREDSSSIGVLAANLSVLLIYQLVNSPNSESASGDSIGDCVMAALSVLEQGKELLGSISQEGWSRRVSVASNSTIGEHYRHCLDHFRCWLDGLESGVLDYDRRQRDSRIETNRAYALSVTGELERAVARLDPSALDRTIEIQCKIHYEGDRTQRLSSTVVRELMYNVAHAVHHYALIAVMAKVMGCRLPVEFGLAPSTLQHRLRPAAVASG